MKLGDKVYVRGQGRMRYGIIDKLTKTRVHVRYTTPTGGTHVKIAGHGQVFATAEEYQADEDRRAREHKAWIASRVERMNQMPVQRLATGVKAPPEDVSYIDFGTLEVGPCRHRVIYTEASGRTFCRDCNAELE